VLKAREDLLGTTSSSSLVYATLDGWRRQMVEQGEQVLGAALVRAQKIRTDLAALPGLQVLGREVVRPGGAADLDPLAITVDVRELGISGLQAVEWLRAERHVDLGSGDTYRVNARITHADDDDTQARLVDAMSALVDAAPQLESPLPVAMPAPRAFELEMAALPRDAFFGPVEQVPAERAAGRVAAEMLSPYPPGVPVLAPGELIDGDVVDYLVTGVQAGMLIPDAADPTLRTLRVVAG